MYAFDAIGSRYSQYSSLENFCQLTWRQIKLLVENLETRVALERKFDASIHGYKMPDLPKNNSYRKNKVSELPEEKQLLVASKVGEALLKIQSGVENG